MSENRDWQADMVYLEGLDECNDVVKIAMHWLQQYAAEKERADEAEQERNQNQLGTNKEIKVVSKDKKKLSTDVRWLNISNIKGGYSEGKSGKSKMVYQTEDGEYIDAIGVEHTLKLFEAVDGFVRTDRGAMANLKAIECIDEDNKYLYINKSKNRFITIAASRWEHVKECFLALKKRG